MPYRLLYALRYTPWDTGRVPEELIELCEGPDSLSPGRALDLGCGTGTQSLYLSDHDWDTTGIDCVNTAIQRATRKSSSHAKRPTWILGDVSHRPDLNVGDAYRLVIDIGCLFAFSREQRFMVMRTLTEITLPGARLLRFGFTHLEDIAQTSGSEWDVLWHRQQREPQRSPTRAGPSWSLLERR